MKFRYYLREGYRDESRGFEFKIGDRVAERYNDSEFNVGTVVDIQTDSDGIQYKVEWDYSDGPNTEWLYGDLLSTWVEADGDEGLMEAHDSYSSNNKPEVESCITNGKLLRPQHEAVEDDKEDKFVLYFPNVEPKIISRDRAIRQMEVELAEFKYNSGSRIAGRGFGIYCLQSRDTDTDTVWTGRYSSKEFLKVLDESMLKESVDTTPDFPYMFFYNCNNPTFDYDFQLFARSLGARKVYGRYKGTGAGSYFYLVPSESVYDRLKAVAKSEYTVEMQRLLPYDAEKYPKIQFIDESLNEDSNEDVVWPIGPSTLTVSDARERIVALRGDIKLFMTCDTVEDVKAHAEEFQIYDCVKLVERKMANGMTESEAIDSTETYLMKCLSQWKSDIVKFKDDTDVAMRSFNLVKDALSQYELISADEDNCVLKYQPVEGATHKDCIQFVDAVVAAVGGRYNGTGRGGSWTRWDIITSDGVKLKAGWDGKEDIWSVSFPRLKFESRLNELYWINEEDVMQEVKQLGIELEADGWKVYGDRYSGSTYYEFYVKRENNQPRCKAIQYNYNGAQVIDITVDQLSGFKPIDDFDVMRRKLGKMLLPNNKNIVEAFDADKVQKRIAHVGEFDNGHVIHNDFFRSSAAEAEEKARTASLEDPTKIFYVQYDDIMNPSSDFYWKDGIRFNEYLQAAKYSRKD